MRNHRKWWMGFGIGVVVGASMLQLITFAKNADQALIVADGGQMYTQQQLDEAVSKAAEEARRTSVASSAPEASPSGSPSAPSAADPAGNAPASPSPSPSASPAAKVSFYINPGMDLKTVARSLKRLGLIDDADDFTDEARPYSKQIQPGTSEFVGKPGYKEIIDELIRVKDD